MANWATLKAAIARVIKTNGNQEITGAILQSILFNVISSIGEKAAFAGIAELSTNPGSEDGPVFYFAVEAGTYPNFSGITVGDNEFCALIQAENGEWEKVVIGPTKAYVDALAKTVSIIESQNVFLTEEEYEALEEKDSSKLYYIYEE